MKIQIAAAVALAASTVAVAAPAHAACGQFAFTGFTAINQSNGYRLEFNSTGTQASGPVTAFNNHQSAVLHGTISGGIAGREVNLSVLWGGGGHGGGEYSGSVNDQGMARGDTHEVGMPTNGSATWNIRDALVCAG